VADVHDRWIRFIDERIQRHRALADHNAFGELGSADQREVQRQRKSERADREQSKKRTGCDLKRSVPAQPPDLVSYLVT
jgi:hypothetical protein